MTKGPDQARDACGVFGIFAPQEDVARVTFFGLFALQHRGQESAGIATTDGHRIYLHTGMGLVAQVFDEFRLARLPGYAAIGHTRYSTTGSSNIYNAQPILVGSPVGQLAIAHNGNIVNAAELQAELVDRGATFGSTTDSEVIAHLIALSPGHTWVDKIRAAMARLEGAYSLALLTHEAVYAVRDPLGIRPLALGRYNGSWVFASETCALDHVGAELVREVEPGEIVEIAHDGLRSYPGQISPRQAFCIFELIYLARPDSRFSGQLIYLMREAMGAELAREHPVEADLVTGVPDSAIPAAIGYARASGIPFRETLIKNRYVGRTFIQPDQRMRSLGVQLKFNPLPEVMRGKRVVVVDDSIVRGTTTPRVVRLLREAGAREVHLRICAPPIRWPCYYGVDMATREELIAARKTVAEIAAWTGADSLGYLSVEGLLRAVGLPGARFCLACFTGNYPLPIPEALGKFVLEAPAAR
jgi:amidophosphoribosyltransferase